MFLEWYKQGCALICDVFKELQVDPRLKTLIFDTEVSLSVYSYAKRIIERITTE